MIFSLQIAAAPAPTSKISSYDRNLCMRPRGGFYLGFAVGAAIYVLAFVFAPFW